MNTPNETHNRSKKIHVQIPGDLSTFIPEEIIEHNALVKSLTRSAEPKNFSEYRQWLADYRAVIHRIAKVRREFTVAHLNWKRAGGYGRLEKNCSFPMTTEIEQAYRRASDTFRAHQCGEGESDLIKLRTARKPLGAHLWLAASQEHDKNRDMMSR